jgi:3'-5' exoribonuclease
MASTTTTSTTSQTTKTNPSPATRNNVVDLIPGTTVNELFVIHDLQLRQGGKTGQYVTFRLKDATGALRGVYWPEESGEAEAFLEEIREGAVVRVKGDVVAFRGQSEVRVTASGGGVSPFMGSRLDPEPFIPTSGVSQRELRDAVEVRLGLIGDRHLRRILRAFFADKDRANAYFSVPARLNGPHDYLRGLAEEAVETARIAGAAAASVPGIDRDLVTAAALFAPAGALLAYEEAGLTHEATRDGMLLPLHILSADLATQAAREAGSVPEHTIQRLRHVLLREGEAPRLGWANGPDAVLPEAVVLHHALQISRMVPQAITRMARIGLENEEA